MISKNGLVVVADGHGATLYRNTADKGAPVELREQITLGPRDLRDDGPAGAAGSDSSPRDIDEATFAKQLTQRLNRMAMDGDAEEVVIIVDPTTLGEMRRSYHAMLEKAIVKEIPKTLTQASPDEIAAALE
ncbi:MAG: host attachment protein [Thermoleophilia bacterium]|nr:host attachment protein [Thermoleophilia bacterium]